MTQILKITNIYKEKIWGNKDSLLKKDIINDYLLGEVWITGNVYSNQYNTEDELNKRIDLATLYDENRELFGNFSSERFPFLLKFIDAKEKLSLQVHPKNDIKNEKNEFWHILDCENESSIYFGHSINDENEFKKLLSKNELDQHLNQIKVNTGDSYFVASGTLHAINKGILLYEVQQNIDVTYRIFDYNRKNDDGNLRELHLEEGLKEMRFPDPYIPINSNVITHENYVEEKLINNEYFQVTKLTIENQAIIYPMPEYFSVVGCVKGSGTINDQSINFGDHFLVPNDIKFINVKGQVSLMITSPGVLNNAK